MSLTKKSRYRDSPHFALREDGSEVFPGLRSRKIGPASAVIEHEVEADNRLDRLAGNYYGNDRLWWRIVDANPENIFSGDLLDADDADQVILIPKARE